MGEILVMTLAYIRLPIRTLGGGRGNSVKRGSYRHAAYVCFDERLLLANVLGWVSQFWGTQYSCSVKYFEVSVVHQKNFYKIHFWAFAFPILMLSIFGQNPRLRLATIFADELISKTHGALGNFLATTEARTVCPLFKFLHRRYKMNANAIKILSIILFNSTVKENPWYIWPQVEAFLIRRPLPNQLYFETVWKVVKIYLDDFVFGERNNCFSKIQLVGLKYRAWKNCS